MSLFYCKTPVKNNVGEFYKDCKTGHSFRLMAICSIVKFGTRLEGDNFSIPPPLGSNLERKQGEGNVRLER